MPDDTPPARVKNAWRMPGTLDSNSDSSVMQPPPARPPRAGGSSLSPGSVLMSGCDTPSTLNSAPMAPRPGAGQSLQGRLDIRRHLRARLAHQRRRARLDAEAPQEIALLHRPVQPRAGIFRAERKRLEIDMRGQVGLSRIAQRIGETVAGDCLERIAGIAAHMAVVDDQRRAALIAHAAADPHDLRRRPPFEDRAGGRRAHQWRQQQIEMLQAARQPR